MRELPEVLRWTAERVAGYSEEAGTRPVASLVDPEGGEWPAAEAGLVAALADLEAMRPGMAPDGVARLGDLRARHRRRRIARN